MKHFKKIPVKKIVDIYEKKGCNLSATAKSLKITRQTLWIWRKQNEELNQAMTDAEETILDNTESSLISQIREGNITAIIFYLKTKGKSRGYYERVENDVNVNAFEQLMKELPDEIE